MGVKIWVNKSRVYFSISLNKKRYRESTGLKLTGNASADKKILEMAEELRANKELQIISVEKGLVSYELKNIHLQEYLESIKGEWKSGGVIPNCLRILRMFNENPKITDISKAWCNQFCKKVHELPLKPSSVATYISAMKSVFNHAIRDDIIQFNPMSSVVVKKCSHTQKAVLTIEDIDKISKMKIKDKNKHVHLAFLFSCFTGLRISDLRTLDWKDIDFTNNLLIKTMKKTNSKVFVPLSTTAINILKPLYHGQKSGIIFSSMKYSKLAYFNRLERELNNGKHISWHVARVAYANMLFNANVDIYTIQRLMGHTSISSTEFYARVSDRRKQDAISRLPEIDI